MLKLTVSPEAAQWYIEEMDLEQGDHIRFYISIYGQSVHPNYSLGIVKEKSNEMAIHTTVEGITFYFDQQDEWFLDGHKLLVEFNPQKGEVEFHYEKLT